MSVIILWTAPPRPLSEASPCASFQGAINKGNVVQINRLASGHYGEVLITTSLTIDCGSGNVGNIVNSSASGITISTTAAATIILRHLALNGLSTANGVSGITAFLFQWHADRRGLHDSWV